MSGFRIIVLAAMVAASPVVCTAQGLKVAFGGMAQDSSAPVEVTSDTLSIDQENGTAEFLGNVLVGQGSMRLSAPKVRVIYDDDAARISRLLASGGVTLVSGEDAAEARDAEYDIDGGRVRLLGDVLLVQGQTTLSAGEMLVNLEAGTAVLSGRVRTILQTGDN